MPQTHTLKDKIATATLALSLAFGTAAPAIAQDASANENIQQASLQASNEVITSEQALERSSGKIVLHYGEGYSPSDVRSLERNIERIVGIDVDIYAGGTENSVEFYIFNQKIPKVFDFESSTEILVIADSIAKKHNLGNYENSIDPS